MCELCTFCSYLYFMYNTACKYIIKMCLFFGMDNRVDYLYPLILLVSKSTAQQSKPRLNIRLKCKNNCGEVLDETNS